ncbi:MAG: type II toxin-antitoxin system VapC family toxin [Bifidobacteriaceae bacterium]|jgi:predicted nucleic acid-binding protein|nr:type II toxin-antitoxin system VapC family toxin [Bifidobacteriaceae bacterium]
MSAPHCLVDTSVLLYAIGAPHPLRDDCAKVLRLLATGEVEGYASVEMIQEALHHRLRVSGARAASVKQCSDIEALVTLLPFDVRVLHRAMELVKGGGGGVRGRDAVHAATALVYGIDQIISTDPAFDRVPDLTRLAPGDLV